jgi:hypothetical protein
VTDTGDTSRILRFEVDVDDRWRIIRIPAPGDVLAVGCRRSCTVEFWVREDPQAGTVNRAFRVYGTGHPFPPSARWDGTTPDVHQALIWHLVSVPADTPPE